MDTFIITDSTPISNQKAIKQLEKFITKELDSRAQESDVTDTTRARISEDVFSQIETATDAIRNANGL